MFVAILVWYLVQAVFFAFASYFEKNYAIPPDETYHRGFVNFYADNSWWPWLSSDAGFEGDWREITRTPQYLYHFLMSYPARLFQTIGFSDTTVALRLVNVALGLTNLIVLRKLLAAIGLSRTTTLTSIFILSNLMMYTVLSGAINYDNLANLVASLMLYLSVSYLSDTKRKTTLGVLAVVAIFAPIIKFSLAPFVLLIFLLLVFKAGPRTLSNSVKGLLLALWRKHKPTFVIAMLLLLAAIMFGERYIGNYVTYGSPTPSCDTVLSDEVCQRSPLYRRNASLSPPTAEQTIPLTEFAPKWIYESHRRVVGAMSASTVRTFDVVEKFTFFAWIALAIGALALRRKASKGDTTTAIFLLSWAYLAIIMLHNYSLFGKYATFGLALQGRYMLPVYILTWAIPLKWTLDLLKNSRLKLCIATAACVVFFVGGFPAHIVRAPETNYEVQYREPVTTVSNILRSVIPNISSDDP